MAEEEEEDEDHNLTPADAEDLLLRLAAEQEVSPLSMDSAYDPSYVMDLSPRPVGGEGPVMSYATVILRAVCACREPSLTPRESIQWAAYVVVKTLAPIARSHPDPRVFEALLRGLAEVRAGYEDDNDEAVDPPTPGPRRRGRRAWYPLRYALGWLLLGELQREPGVVAARVGAAGDGCGGGVGVSDGQSRRPGESESEEEGAAASLFEVGGGTDDSVSEWAAGLARRLAAEAAEEGQEGERVEEGVGVAPYVDEYSKDLFGPFQVGGHRADDDDAVRRLFGVLAPR